MMENSPRETIVSPTSPRGLDDPGVGDDLLDLVRRGLAAHVLFLHHIFQMRALVEPVRDVLDHPLSTSRPARAVAEDSRPGSIPKATLLPHQRILLRSWHHASSRAA